MLEVQVEILWLEKVKVRTALALALDEFVNEFVDLMFTLLEELELLEDLLTLPSLLLDVDGLVGPLGDELDLLEEYALLLDDALGLVEPEDVYSELGMWGILLFISMGCQRLPG